MYAKLTKMLIFLGILFGAIFAYQIFKSIMMKKYISAMGHDAITISAQKIQSSPWDPRVFASASMRAVNGVDVTTEIAGMVRSIMFRPGAMVKKGDILVILNDDVELAQLKSLQAQAEIAKTTYLRDKAQFEVHAVSKQTLDNDAANLKNINAQVEEQKATIAKKIITAPFGGKLGISAINLGQYLQPGDKIVTLQTLSPIYADFYLPQQELPKIKVGQTVTLLSDTYPGEKFMGKITTINPKVDVATRNVQIEATVANDKQRLFPGMFATIDIVTGQPKSFLTLPQTAITFNPYGEIAYTITEKGKDKNDKPILIANQTFVTLGERRGDQVSILKGLKEGDLVVISGGHKLKNGAMVAINNSVLPTDNAQPEAENE